MENRFQKGALAAVVAATLTTAAAAHVPGSGSRANRKFASKSAAGTRRGRPRKFSRPSRSVSLTLPDDVIASLQAIDSDLSLAIVRIAQALSPADAPPAPAELASYGGRSVIIVPRRQLLKERTGVELVPLTDGRALMAFDSRMTIPQLELRIGDAIADRSIDGHDRTLFETLAEILKDARRSDRIELRERSIIVLQATRSTGDKSIATEDLPASVPA
jgi:hypothetical protein